MRRVARPVHLLLALALAGVGMIVGAAPCFACTCAPPVPSVLLRDADAAFVGRVVGSTVDEEGTTQTFEVEGVFKGELGPTVDVWAQIGGEALDTCAVVFPEGERRALVLRRSDGRWTTGLCSLVTEAQLTRVAGPPSPPSGSISAPPSPPPAPTEAGGFRAASSGPPGWTVAIVGVLIGIAFIWVVVFASSRRERRAPAFVAEGGVEPPRSDDNDEEPRSR